MLGAALERKMAPNWEREGERDKPGSLGTTWEGEVVFCVCPSRGDEDAPRRRGQEGTAKAAGVGQDPADGSLRTPPSLTLAKIPVRTPCFP